jgi:hypothetical protein
MRTFDPWVGQHYLTKGVSGVRVMVLGESHYGTAGTESAGFTQSVVRDIGQQRRHRFFTTVQKLILGLGPGWLSPESRAEFWETVAFYNFVQTFVGHEARMRPTEAMWQAGAKPFLQTLEELKPDFLLVLGKELTRWVPELPQDLKVLALPHPASMGFRCAVHQPTIQAIFDSLLLKQTPPD